MNKARTKIMTVDDSRVMRRIITGSIEMLEYQALTAKNGKEALDLLAEQGEEVALILLDWNMPVMNGIDTLKAIKKDPQLKVIPVMMVTSEQESTNVVQAIQAGAKHYLAKPFSQQDLAIRMMECLGLGV